MTKKVKLKVLLMIGAVMSVLMASQAVLAKSGTAEELLIGSDHSKIVFTSSPQSMANSECALPVLEFDGTRASVLSPYVMKLDPGSRYKKIEEKAFAYDIKAGLITYYDLATLDAKKINLLGTYTDSTRTNKGLWSIQGGQCEGSYTSISKLNSLKS